MKEAKAPNLEEKEITSGDVKVTTPVHDNISLEERQLLGRYGVWLLVGRCTPCEDTPVEILGRLLAMLFHWFHVTAYSYDGQEESTLEKLKNEYVCTWLQNIRTTHNKLFLSCLLPHPPEYARVGGHWCVLIFHLTNFTYYYYYYYYKNNNNIIIFNMFLPGILWLLERRI